MTTSPLSIVAATLLAASAASAAEAGWTRQTAKDPMTDAVTTVWRIEASGPVVLRSQPTVPELVVACDTSNTLNVYVDWHGFIAIGVPVPQAGGQRRHPVATRLDDTPAETQDWAISQNREATFSREQRGLLASLRSGRRLLVATMPAGSNQAVAEFQLAGVDKVIDDIRHDCPL